MRLSSLKFKQGSRKPRTRLGRGVSAGKGASCGKGMRGQKSRSGPGVKSGFEGGQVPLYRRLPKLKGFQRYNVDNKCFVLNVSDLNHLPEGTVVDESVWSSMGYSVSGQRGIKVLGDGEISVSLVVHASSFSKVATQKIVTAGGTCHSLSLK